MTSAVILWLVIIAMICLLGWGITTILTEACPWGEDDE